MLRLGGKRLHIGFSTNKKTSDLIGFSDLTAGKRCGERKFIQGTDLKVGEASPEEFPWTCLILNSNDVFIGGCAIIAENSENNIQFGTPKVITVAHKLTKVKKDE